MYCRRLVAAVLVMSLSVVGTGVIQAQSVPAAPPATPPAAIPASSAAGEDTLAAGLLLGDVLAEQASIRGNVAAGFGLGLLTGLIGTGIGYFVVGPAPLSAEALQRSVGKSADYQLGLKTAWDRRSRAKKRKGFLVGGLVGTLTFVVIAVELAEED